MAGAKAWKLNDPTQPDFPDDFEIAKKAVLQVTDIKNNNNKYYGIELHCAHADWVKAEGAKAEESAFRVFTHYGRTDDLERDPNAGAKESRYFDSLGAAQAEYERIYREKTGKSKGYKEVALASSKIGSQRARGTSSGHVDDKTIAKMKGEETEEKKPEPKKSELPAGVQELVKYIYAEATSALTSTVAAKITANGIETPLGVLTVGQVEKGEAILTEIYDLFQSGKGTRSKFEDLSGEFYSAIPHRIGRTRDAIAAAVIAELGEISQKQETLQLMKDMLAVNGEKGSVLFDDKVDEQHRALGCVIGKIENGSPTYREWEEHVLQSQVKSKNIKIVNIFTVKRNGEFDGFDTKVGNEKMLFHGSRIKNWVGILSRGILMPKIVVSMGVNRTDAGWLGNGIYFGDASCTSAFYTTPGTKKTRFMAIARVGLGKMKAFTKITYGLNEPPAGYDSCHGVRNQKGAPSQFEDDEYVIYRQNQQRIEYLVEFKV
jgi:poly [ADP-ribose] polymerase 2/3/4